MVRERQCHLPLPVTGMASIAWVARLQVPGFWATGLEVQVEQATQPGHLIMAQALPLNDHSAVVSGAGAGAVVIAMAAVLDLAGGAGQEARALVEEAARVARAVAVMVAMAATRL